MRKIGDSFELSATDLVGYLHCRHLTALDRAVAEDALAKPKIWDPFLQILLERGAAHEQSYVEHLTRAGLEPSRRSHTLRALFRTITALRDPDS